MKKNLAILALVMIECCLCFMLYNLFMDNRTLKSTILEQQRVIETYKKIEEKRANGGEDDV